MSDSTIKWQDEKGIIHLCESSKAPSRDTLVWTICGVDVPANTGFRSDEKHTCVACEGGGDET